MLPGQGEQIGPWGLAKGAKLPVCPPLAADWGGGGPVSRPLVPTSSSAEGCLGRAVTWYPRSFPRRPPACCCSETPTGLPLPSSSAARQVWAGPTWAWSWGPSSCFTRVGLPPGLSEWCGQGPRDVPGAQSQSWKRVAGVRVLVCRRLSGDLEKVTTFLGLSFPSGENAPCSPHLPNLKGGLQAWSLVPLSGHANGRVPAGPSSGPEDAPAPSLSGLPLRRPSFCPWSSSR